MMRALVMDFANDKKVWNIDNEYLFGKSILVCPVTKPMYTKVTGVERRDSIRVSDFSIVKSQQVYLPKGTDWYDFWTNEKFSGGQTIQKQTPLDILPLYVKAGTILPLGPDVQFATEKKWDHLEIMIYPGADATFTLYEDEFDNYNYEKGAYSEITFAWNNASRKLTIGAINGAYPGMLEKRTFIVTLPDGTKKTLDYTGKKIEVK